MTAARHSASADSLRAPVSVVIPCYRCGATLRRALESVAAQSSLPAEVILVDDCSQDGTLELLRELQREFGAHWIKVIALARNLGAGGARNTGWDAASGKYVAFLDADDAWHPRKIETQYAFMEGHREFSLCGHGHRRIENERNGDAAPLHPGYRRISFWQLLLSNRFITPSVMLRREVASRFLGGARYMEDHLLWLEIASSGAQIAYLDEALAFIYKAPFGESGLSARMLEMEKAELANYWRLRKTGSIGLAVALALLGYSLVKYARRVLIVRLRS